MLGRRDEKEEEVMADASYDAIVVGGGHHGTIIACYLQQAGLKTVIFERQHELGEGRVGRSFRCLVFCRTRVLILLGFGRILLIRILI